MIKMKTVDRTFDLLENLFWSRQILWVKFEMEMLWRHPKSLQSEWHLLLSVKEAVFFLWVGWRGEKWKKPESGGKIVDYLWPHFSFAYGRAASRCTHRRGDTANVSRSEHYYAPALSHFHGASFFKHGKRITGDKWWWIMQTHAKKKVPAGYFLPKLNLTERALIYLKNKSWHWHSTLKSRI